METFYTYTIRIIGPSTREDSVARLEDEERAQVREALTGRVFNDVEDIINDQLPDGWQAKVSEWDQ